MDRFRAGMALTCWSQSMRGILTHSLPSCTCRNGYNRASSEFSAKRPMTFDLHSHTNISDGELDPRALVMRARSNGVDCLSITDHDSIGAYDSITETEFEGMTIVRGIELSAKWGGRSVHV
ncbi:MAG: PHP domain-containing protein, partial [Woeseiaceae bacterium]